MDIFFISGFGTGNYLQAIFMMRMAVRYISIARVKLNITCTDKEEVQWDLILPWYTGAWYSPEYFDSVNTLQDPNLRARQGPSEPSSSAFPPLSDNIYCGSSYGHPTALMYEEMKYDARRMAVALLGESLNGIDHHLADKIHNFVKKNFYLRDEKDESKDPKQSVRLLPGNQQERINATMQLTPIISPDDQFEIDDAVLHVRCGDILSTNAGSYGFLSFPGYSRHISPDVRTIGILAQSFCQEPNASDSKSMKWERRERQRDANHCLRCQTLTVAFAQFLSEQFPNATVNIRNDPSEPISLVYARMVLANQTVGCLSTFTIYPVLATFGTGYYLRPTPGYSSSWVTDSQHPVMNSANVDNFELFDDNLLHIPDVKKLWDSQGEEAVIEWLRTGGVAEKNTEA